MGYPPCILCILSKAVGVERIHHTISLYLVYALLTFTLGAGKRVLRFSGVEDREGNIFEPAIKDSSLVYDIEEHRRAFYQLLEDKQPEAVERLVCRKATWMGTRPITTKNQIALCPASFNENSTASESKVEKNTGLTDIYPGSATLLHGFVRALADGKTPAVKAMSGADED